MLSQGFKFPTAGVQGQNSSETLWLQESSAISLWLSVDPTSNKR